MELPSVTLNSVEIKLNTTTVGKNTLHTVNSLDKLDEILIGTVPKMFYRYRIAKDGIYISVPKEFEDRIRKLVTKTLFIDLIGFRSMTREYLTGR